VRRAWAVALVLVVLVVLGGALLAPSVSLAQEATLHGGGMDLKFPHHENEIAQSEAATGKTFVNYWMHNGFVRVDDEKMSKSLGNFFTVREILKRYRAEEVRYFILASHYRSPLNYSHENLDNSKAALARLYTTLRGIKQATGQNAPVCETYNEAFHKAMDDDFVIKTVMRLSGTRYDPKVVQAFLTAHPKMRGAEPVAVEA